MSARRLFAPLSILLALSLARCSSNTSDPLVDRGAPKTDGTRDASGPDADLGPGQDATPPVDVAGTEMLLDSSGADGRAVIGVIGQAIVPTF